MEIPLRTSSSSSLPISHERTGKGKFGIVFLSQLALQKSYVAIKYILKQYLFETSTGDRIANVRIIA